MLSLAIFPRGGRAKCIGSEEELERVLRGFPKSLPPRETQAAPPSYQTRPLPKQARRHAPCAEVGRAGHFTPCAF